MAPWNLLFHSAAASASFGYDPLARAVLSLLAEDHHRLLQAGNHFASVAVSKPSVRSRFWIRLSLSTISTVP